MWSNPEVQVRLFEEKGVLEVYERGRRAPGCYCKVFQERAGALEFYRDGYTDVSGCFRYALADL